MSDLTNSNYSCGIVIENRKNGVVVTPLAPEGTGIHQEESMVFSHIDDLIGFVRANVTGAHGVVPETVNSQPNVDVMAPLPAGADAETEVKS